MKKLCSLGIATLLALALVGCGDEDHHDHHDHVVVTPSVFDILSDPTLDGEITKDVATGIIGVPTVATNTMSVLAGIDVDPVTGVSVSESRGFLIFPLAALPSNASIQFASLTVFVNSVSFVTSSTAPIPFLLDSIDTILFPPPIVSRDFDSRFRTSRSLSFFGGDAGNFVEIDVTSLLTDAQAQLLPQFEVRILFDEARFQHDLTTTRGLIEMDDRATDTSRAPLLHVEFF
jgi:hypothetical protein